MTLVVKQKDKREDTVANLRSGAAAANAVALMQGKGIGTSRRSQFCLTPGTVKFAAFHVLSLEGDKGLSIGEVVKRIKVCCLPYYVLPSGSNVCDGKHIQHVPLSKLTCASLSL
jgi:hypothetical protein